MKINVHEDGELLVNEKNEIYHVNDELFDVIVKCEKRNVNSKCFARILYVEDEEIKMCDSGVQLGILATDQDTEINVYNDHVEIVVD